MAAEGGRVGAIDQYDRTSGRPSGTRNSRLQRVRSDAFSRAQRHSRTVRMLKFALPSIGVILAVGFVGIPIMSTPPSGSIAEQTDGRSPRANW